VVHLLRPIAVTAYPGSPATSKPGTSPANHSIRGLAWVLVLLVISPTAYKHVYRQSCRCLTHSPTHSTYSNTHTHTYHIDTSIQHTYVEYGLQAYSIPARKAHTMSGSLMIHWIHWIHWQAYAVGWHRYVQMIIAAHGNVYSTTAHGMGGRRPKGLISWPVASQPAWTKQRSSSPSDYSLHYLDERIIFLPLTENNDTSALKSKGTSVSR